MWFIDDLQLFVIVITLLTLLPFIIGITCRLFITSIMDLVDLAFMAFVVASVPFVVPIAFTPFIKDITSNRRSCIAGMERWTKEVGFT